jgi:hypothetical protein
MKLFHQTVRALLLANCPPCAVPGFPGKRTQARPLGCREGPGSAREVRATVRYGSARFGYFAVPDRFNPVHAFVGEIEA